mmetsp:Transcript_801/g.1979  ORF Transcript_801/g.1979 Transcript_801/m.1979 type:complete len:205 (-) Transcript_801:771-1385(-)
MHHDGMERKYHLVVGMVVPPSPASPSSTVAPAIAAATMVTSPATSSSSTTVESSATAPSSPATVLAAGTRSRLLVMVSRHVDALGGDLEVSSLEFRPVQLDGVRNRGLRLMAGERRAAGKKTKKRIRLFPVLYCDALRCVILVFVRQTKRAGVAANETKRVNLEKNKTPGKDKTGLDRTRQDRARNARTARSKKQWKHSGQFSV